ncbi:MAG: GAF domain-containing sensor histidine kinase [Anaerolineales bacterium]|nr:GAF domain-containing sensor histidine kinase [Anaerolineales bacterium]
MEQTKTLERLLEVTRNLSATVDLDAYVQTLLSAAAELTESESASILEYDEATQDFHFRFVPWFHREAIQRVRVPLTDSIAGWVFLHEKPLSIPDVKQDTRHYPKIDELSNFTTSSLLGVPLILHGRPVGVFEVFNKAGSAQYSEADVLIMETLASLASTAIQNSLLEQSAQASMEGAKELDRLKSEFIAITSHELRTPLGLILGHSTFLRELVGSEYHEQVDAIIRNASRLKEIIENLSRVDNYQTGGATLHEGRASIARIIEDTVLSFNEMAAQAEVSLKANLPEGDDLIVNVDAKKVSIAVSNLVKNAVMFGNPGGRVSLRAERQPDAIKVIVEDNGIGVPAKDLPHIFERFYQVESHLTRKHSGMGLGLSVAKAMIEMHGGKIWAESFEGIGSTFTFVLPINAPEPPKQPFIV